MENFLIVLKKFYLNNLIALVILLLITACDKSSDETSPDKTSKISTYAGSWYQNGTTGTQDAKKTLNLNTDLSYIQTINQYETTSKLTLSSIKVSTAVISEISTDETDSTYDTVYIDISKVEITPKTSSQAEQWNNDEYGGETDWIVDSIKTFNSDNPGNWEFGSIWLSNVAVSVKREGDLLNVNERGGFDGNDPPEDVYFLQ